MSYTEKKRHSFFSKQKKLSLKSGSSTKLKGISRGRAAESAEAFRQSIYKENPEAKEQREFFGEPVSIYTSNEAVEDGLLFDLDQVTSRYFKNSPFNLATTNLLSKGYLTEDKVNVPNMIDLIMAANKIISKMPPGDRFASGRIELPNGDKQQIFIAQNETGRFTIMLPEDY